MSAKYIRRGGSVAAVMLTIVSLALLYNVVMAQEQVGQPRDEDVVATVGDVAVIRGDITAAADYRHSTGASVSPEQAVNQVIVYIIDTAIQQAEAKRLGYEASDEETMAFVQPIRVACSGPQGAECREEIRNQGLTEEEYWRTALPGYRQELSAMNLWNAHLGSRFPDGATFEERWETRDVWVASLRRSAVIEWQDEGLREAYERALLAAN